MESIITIHIRWKTIRVNKNILINCPLFKSMFEDLSDLQEISLDRNPIIFEHVLSLMYEKNYPFPEEFEDELTFYQMHDWYLETKLEKMNICNYVNCNEMRLINCELRCLKHRKTCSYSYCDELCHPENKYCDIHKILNKNYKNYFNQGFCRINDCVRRSGADSYYCIKHM